MNNELTILGNDVSKADIFFGQRPALTDWDAVLAAPDKIDVPAILAQISAMEPLGIASPDMPKIFVMQQMIRIALRYKKGLPLTLKRTCATCGVHQDDPALDSCLYCHEEETLAPAMPGYRSDRLRVVFDPTSDSWGLLFTSGYGDDKYVFWAVQGFKTRMDAQLSFYPIVLYNRWLQRETNGMTDADAGDLINIDILMSLTLPLKPLEFEQLLREQIASHMDKDRNYYGTTVDAAINEHDREHSH